MDRLLCFGVGIIFGMGLVIGIALIMVGGDRR